MFTDGLVEETQSLLRRYGSARNVMALDSLGYRQAAQFLRGEFTREQAVSAAQQGHRNYAKRQMTWFRREPEVVWLEGFGDDPEIVKRAMELVIANRSAVAKELRRLIRRRRFESLPAICHPERRMNDSGLYQGTTSSRAERDEQLQASAPAKDPPRPKARISCQHHYGPA